MDNGMNSKVVTSESCSDSPPINVLNRYTSIDNMYEIISKSAIRMSDPKYWEDKNDVCILDEYKIKANFKSLFVLCFNCESETIYHWGAFSEKNSACCIEFDASKLIDCISGDKNIRNEKVKYIKIKDLKNELLDIKDIPFSKRFPYRNESEYRIIFESKEKIKEKIITIDLSMVRRITINQHLSKDVFGLIKKDLEDKYKIKVNRSTVIDNKAWINYVKKMKPNFLV